MLLMGSTQRPLVFLMLWVNLCFIKAFRMSYLSWGANADPNVPPPNLLAICSDTKIIQMKSHTYMDHRTHESFACTAIIPAALNVKESSRPRPVSKHSSQEPCI